MDNEGINRKTAGGSVRHPQDRRAARERGCIVLLFDSACERMGRINRIIIDAGAIPRLVDPAAVPAFGELTACDAIALVAVATTSEENQAGLGLIVRLKNAGFNIFAYEDGVNQWTVRSKCRPILAGAMHLLDSSSAGFGAELLRLLQQALLGLADTRREQQEIGEMMRHHGMVGESVAITAAFRTAMRFSLLSDLPVLITGDTGTGKELVARAIAKMDTKRQKGPFVSVNCAAVNPTLMESVFFGHRRGAFTGAERDRKGLIRAAEGGTLFLDEIGELEIGLQAKLLRVLQENSVLGVGEEQEIPVNVRFVAATNRDLEHSVAEKTFRADLFHRLRVLSLHIPSLRERRADIRPLVTHFLRKRQKFGPASVPDASEDFLEAIQQLDLPGNVRQLQNLVYHSLAHHQSSHALDLMDLPEDALRELTGRPYDTLSSPAIATSKSSAPLRPLPQADLNELVKRILDRQGWNLSSAVREYERRVFQAAMDQTQGNQSKAARLLGITARSVYNKLHRHQLRSSPAC